jgi:4-alpha-glucanotransferase
MAIFRQMWENMGHKPVIVEDLGYMTESVRQMVRDTGFPNMKVLQFGFDGEDYDPANDYLLHNIPEHCVVYPGTHDNDPINGWFGGLSPVFKNRIKQYFGCEDVPDDRMHEVFIRAALISRASISVIALQDWLGLGHEARINDPARLEDNWHWRWKGDSQLDELADRICENTRRYGRLNPSVYEK